MSLRAKVVSSSFSLTAGQVVAAVCSFARNIILARMLTKEDFGIASTFALTTTLFELTGKIAIDRQVVQSRDGEDPRFMATAHALQAAFGVAGALLILLAAWPMASFFRIPHALWAFQLLALIPLAKGLFHLDVNRRERELRFGPLILSEAVPDVLITLAAWPLAAWMGDYRALLWLLLARWGLQAVLTHAMAERPYRLALDRRFLGPIYRFSWPLLLNGFLMVGIMQGDQLIVGNRYSMADLGMYFLAVNLALTPGMMFIKVLYSVMLPLMARAQDDPAEFERRYVQSTEMLSLFAMVLTTTLIVGGEAIAVVLFGAKYAGTGTLIAILAAAQAFRLLRVAPTISAMALANTANTLLSNAARAVGLGLAIVLAYGLGWGIVWVAWAGLAGEVLAHLVALRNLAVRHRVRQGQAVRSMAVTVLVIGLAGATFEWGVPRASLGLVILAMAAFGALSAGAAMAFYPSIREQAAGFVRPWRPRAGSATIS